MECLLGFGTGWEEHMITKNSWIQTNILERLNDKSIDFKVTFNFYKEKLSKTFKQACISAAKEISKKYPKIYLAYSGGLDSTYTAKVLKEAKVNFESITIELSDKELLKTYGQEVWRQIDSAGIFYVPVLLAARQVKEKGGILITGEHMLDEYSGNLKLVINDYDVICDALVDPNLVLPFFMYSEDIVYHMVKDHTLNGLKVRQKLYKDDRALPRNNIDRELHDLYFAMTNKLDPKVKRSVFVNRTDLLKGILDERVLLPV